jgi:hypothetical protein
MAGAVEWPQHDRRTAATVGTPYVEQAQESGDRTNRSWGDRQTAATVGTTVERADVGGSSGQEVASWTDHDRKTAASIGAGSIKQRM